MRPALRHVQAGCAPRAGGRAGGPQASRVRGGAWSTSPEDEAAVRDLRLPILRPIMTVAVDTGLRWSEQAGLEWGHADVLAGLLIGPPLEEWGKPVGSR